ncbi:hypothetical protein P152DRAFT_462251 [Eremomyces bilateralis CBS 781.70]|uniref:Uncharacterized protein n=1 Tax=Eremomyces bilateralis CBS 781.70 TaxID=1392243 RepID=A0A6G1FSJ9_9PEZI|nr:uncharacterized protein P152DRAFT_462251 [Eremomyces bilateralis CBS 781.70]KAF1808688.1 hypothetical protein P152DRAFT_462251 [Eremomyces bilateralis CBS 781.70]
MQRRNLIFLALSALCRAQVFYNKTSGAFVCTKANANFCAGDSLQTDVIFRCNASALAIPDLCSNNLADVPEVGTKPAALCYQGDPTSGTATCEYHGIAYPEDGSDPYSIPAGDGTALPPPTNSAPPPPATNSTAPPADCPTTVVPPHNYTRTPSFTLSSPIGTGTGGPRPPYDGNNTSKPGPPGTTITPSYRTPVGPSGTTGGTRPPSFTGGATSVLWSNAGMGAVVGLILAAVGL